MLFAMTDMPPDPVYVPRALQWNEPMQRLAAAPFGFAPALDLTRFAYVVVHDESPAMRPLVAQAFTPEAELVVSDGDWALFRSLLPVEPLTTPDSRVLEPGTETLASRINQLALQKPPR
jgi:hypothetical protein